MIVREIEQEPFKVIGKFDFFNDYQDTLNYCEAYLKPSFGNMLRAAHEIHMMRKHGQPTRLTHEDQARRPRSTGS